MNRTDRLVAIVMHLQGRRLVRAEELAEHFEISVRTVYRDVAALGEAGVPIVGEAGVGYTLVKGYHLPPVMFTAEEAAALAVAEDLVRELTDRSMAAPMASALAKIRSVLPPERRDEIDRVRRATAIDGSRLRRRAPDATERFLLPAQDAAVKRRVLRLHYRDRGDTTTVREVEPLGVAYFYGAWYLVGWCRLRQDHRHFRIDRIRDLETLGERCPERGGSSLQDHLLKEMTHHGGTDIRVRFAPGAAPRARNDSWHQWVEETATADGDIEAVLRTCSLEASAWWLLAFGGTAEALEPEELREQVARLAAAALAKHDVMAIS